jgi:hypothetical protein
MGAIATRDNPQLIIEKLANGQVSREEAEVELREYWRKAYDEPGARAIIVRLILAFKHLMRSTKNRK